MRERPARSWPTSFGLSLDEGAAAVRLWAPDASRVQLHVESGAAEGAWPLAPEAGGFFSARVPRIAAGDRYRFLIDDRQLVPDPASRFQPDGVHGPSEVVDASTFEWRYKPPVRHRLDRMVVYELHVGAFSPAGTFDGVTERLGWLADLGVTTLELMPVAAFPGGRNWGYDGAAIFAPAAAYGRPDDLRRLVDQAHGHGLTVLLDVVYNHFGPDGAYAVAASSRFFSDTHRSPWGQGINLDGRDAGHVRLFFIENALHWLTEYRLDGLRLDATHALVDDSAVHFLEELTRAVRRSVEDREVLLIAEDERNLRTIVDRPERGGWGIDAVWADDFHHIVRRLVAGDDEAYFEDFGGTTEELAHTVRAGWLYEGQRSTHHGAPRGTTPAGLDLSRFVVCLQNHDQIGNRALGDRLHHAIDPAAWRALSVLLLLAPETPLLFMGQEWAASTPFLYFTDHEPGLGTLVSQGRRREFARFSAFAGEDARDRIPDPQAIETFERSRLRWQETEQPGHKNTLALYRRLLALRRDLAPEAASGTLGTDRAGAAGPDALWLRRRSRQGDDVLVVIRLRGSGRVSAPSCEGWTVWLDTEEPVFADEGQRIAVEGGPDVVDVEFERPGAVVLSRPLAPESSRQWNE